jgi:hypothetical protein
MPLLSLVRYSDVFQQYQNNKTLAGKTVEGDVEKRNV